MIPPQKQMTGMLGHPVAENPIDRMFDAVYAHYGLPWQFWKNDIANSDDLALAIKALRPLGYRGVGITVPYKVAVIPLLDEVDGDVEAIGAANYLTIENGRLIGHNNDGKGVVKAIEKVAPLKGQRVVMLGAGDTGRAMAVELDWAGASPTSPRSPAARSRAARWPSACCRPRACPANGSAGLRPCACRPAPRCS
jgi:shikimate dehydrogenase